MNMTLSRYMGLAITAVVISGLIFGAAISMVKDESHQYKTHMDDNMNSVIQSEMSTP